MGEVKTDFSQVIVHILLTALNDHTNDGMHEIATDILKNIDTLKGSSLIDSAYLLNTSESSLNRFCRKIGMINFSTFRDILNQQVDISAHNSDVFQEEMLQKNYGAMLCKTLGKVEQMDRTVFTGLAEQIHGSQNVIISIATTEENSLKEFQEAMFMHGKLIQIEKNTISLPVIRPDSDTCLIVVSQHLKYARALLSANRPFNCNTVLITQNYVDPVIDNFSRVVRLPECNVRNIQKYVLQRFFEKVLIEYHVLYS